MNASSDARKALATELRAWLDQQSPRKTIKALAEDLGIPYASLKDYFIGRALPKPENARKLYGLTGIPSLSLRDEPTLFPEVEPHPAPNGDLPSASSAQSSPAPAAETAAPVKPSRTGDEESSQGRLVGNERVDEASYKTLRIAVSGDVSLRRLEVALIDTPEFQRLRSIKQLGTSYLVYPSAVHTRFEHSLGTLSEAGTMARCVKENTKSSAGQRRILPEHERLIRLAALLHDVAHIPFGHTLEDETRVVSPRHDEDQDRRTRLLTESEIGRKVVSAIGREEFDLLMRILQAKHEDIAELGEHAYISDIVNNTVCADLLDYLKRDVYFCNLQQSYGERFLKYLYLDYPPENDGDSDRSPARRLIVRLWKEQAWRHRRDVLSELVDLLRVRYYLGEKVYFHHAKISSSAMIARAVWSAMRDGHDPSIRLEDLYHIGDDELLFTLTESKRSVVSTLTQKLLRRDLYKWVYTLSRLEAEAARGVNWSQQLVDDYHLDPNNRTQVEDQLANLCRLEPGDVLIYCPGLDMAGKYARMLVQWKNEYKQLKDVGDEATKGALDAISRSHELLWGLHVFVEPSVFRDSPRQIETLRELCHCKFDPESYAGDRERRLASLVRDLVCEQMGDRGTPALANAAVELVLSKNRGPNPGGPNSAQIAQAIHEVLGGEPGEE